MKVNFNTLLLDLDGNPVKGADGSETTIAALVINALAQTSSPLPEGENLARFLIMRKVHDGEEISIDDAVVIKSACTKIYNPLAFGRVVEVLEGTGK